MLFKFKILKHNLSPSQREPELGPTRQDKIYRDRSKEVTFSLRLALMEWEWNGSGLLLACLL